jgi:hypothetical protein
MVEGLCLRALFVLTVRAVAVKTFLRFPVGTVAVGAHPRKRERRDFRDSTEAIRLLPQAAVDRVGVAAGLQLTGPTVSLLLRVTVGPV